MCPGEQPRGEYIKLNTNENPYSCSPKVKAAIGRAVQAGCKSIPTRWPLEFRNRAGELLGVDPEWILCGNGSDDILTIVTRALSIRASTFVLPAQLCALQDLGRHSGSPVHVVNYESDWSLGEEFTKHRDKLRLAYLANPNSPSGPCCRRTRSQDRRRPALPFAGGRSVRRFRRDQLLELGRAR